jgi:hypothetical protein
MQAPEDIMKEKVTFADIWKTDGQVRALAGGLLADGMLLIIMAVLAAFVVMM